MCVCVCVCERERERERKGGEINIYSPVLNQIYTGFYLTLVRFKRLDTEAVSDQWLDVAVNMLMSLPEENAVDHHSVGSIP